MQQERWPESDAAWVRSAEGVTCRSLTARWQMGFYATYCLFQYLIILWTPLFCCQQRYYLEMQLGLGTPVAQ